MPASLGFGVVKYMPEVRPTCPPLPTASGPSRRVPSLVSSLNCTLPGIALSKLGQPVKPRVVESYLVSDEKSSAPQAAHLYIPLSFVCTYSPVNGASVPFSRKTLYCPGVSFFLNSSSVIKWLELFELLKL